MYNSYKQISDPKIQYILMILVSAAPRYSWYTYFFPEEAAVCELRITIFQKASLEYLPKMWSTKLNLRMVQSQSYREILYYLLRSKKNQRHLLKYSDLY